MTQLVGFINPESPMDPLSYKTRPSRRRNDNTRLDRPRYTITGQDHTPVPDRHLRPGPHPTSGSRAPPRPTPFLRSRIRRTSTHCSFTTDTVEDDWERQTGDARSVRARGSSGVDKVRRSSQTAIPRTVPCNTLHTCRTVPPGHAR